MTDADVTDADVTDAPRWRRVVSRVQRWRRPSPRVRGVLLLVAGVGVLVGAVLSLRALDVRAADLTWWPLVVVAVVMTPVTIAVNALELRVMAAAVRRDGPALGAVASVRAVVLATAANLLPLPGGVLVRIQVVRRGGASTAAATAINLAGAGAWVGTALLVAGVAVAPTAAGAVVLAAMALGVAAIAASAWLVRRVATRAPATAMLRLFGVELLTTLAHGVRLYLVLVALGVPLDLRGALVLGAASPIAAAAGVFPSGIGLAEVLTALLAPLAQLPAAAGFLATAIARVIGLGMTAPLAAALGVGEARRAGASGPATGNGG